MSFEEKNQRWLIQVVGPNGRKSLSMKSTNGRDKGRSKASAFKNHIENLVVASRTGTSLSEAETVWSINLDDETHGKLVAAGLLEPRSERGLSALRPFLEKWFNDREGTKHSTVLTWKNVERNLLAFFGDDKSLRQITEDDAENFQRWLENHEKLAAATVKKRSAIAKQMMASARKARIITVNPFEALKTTARPNQSRQRFISHEVTRKVLDACSDGEWRSLVVLARYGGLRIPSEMRELKWEHVNWSEKCFHIHATKTEHHEDEGNRLVPLFPEVEQELSRLWEEAEEGAVYVLPRLRLTTNVGTTLCRIIERAGLKVWPKPWQNMRASRATELENQFGAHKATEWCGHAEKVAAAHYWMVTGDDVVRAAESVTDPALMQSDAYMMQQGGEKTGARENRGVENTDNSRVFSPVPPASDASIGLEGLEPTTNEL